jgi:hypothetical protein
MAPGQLLLEALLALRQGRRSVFLYGFRASHTAPAMNHIAFSKYRTGRPPPLHMKVWVRLTQELPAKSKTLQKVVPGECFPDTLIHKHLMWNSCHWPVLTSFYVILNFLSLSTYPEFMLWHNPELKLSNDCFKILFSFWLQKQNQYVSVKMVMLTYSVYLICTNLSSDLKIAHIHNISL